MDNQYKEIFTDIIIILLDRKGQFNKGVIIDLFKHFLSYSSGKINKDELMNQIKNIL